MRSTLLFLVLLNASAFGQKVYQSQEVEQSANPMGDAVLLNQFITANLQIPIEAAARGLNGPVYVQGIVEPDGRFTNMQVVKSIDTLCNSETLRVLGLYRAWQPARKDGKAVRQEVTYPVFFRSPPIPNYDPTEQVLYEYFDKNQQPTKDESKYEYRSVIPIDDYGMVRAEVRYEQNRRKGWQTITTLPYDRSEIWIKLSGTNGKDSVRATRATTSSGSSAGAWEETVRQQDGKLLSVTAYPGQGKPPYLRKNYYQSGMLRMYETRIDSTVSTTTWHDTGLIHDVIETNPATGTIVRKVWGRDGRPLVAEGNGWARLSGYPLNDLVIFEQGKVIDGRKQGRWVGQLADSTLVYEEFYENGKFLRGKNVLNGKEIAYDSEYSVAPEFRGGMQEMYKFLGKNLRFSSSEIQKRGEGKLITSFVVIPDGSLKDYRVDEAEGEILASEAMRVIKLMDGKWLPGRHKGIISEERYTLLLGFKSESTVRVLRF